MPRKKKKKLLISSSLKPTIDISKALEFKKHLIAYGYKKPALDFLLYQAANETLGFTSLVSKDDFNFGGVKHQKTFSKSVMGSIKHSAPAKEDEGKSISYGSYKSIDDFIEHWEKQAHLGEMIHDNKIGPPIQADNLKEYVHRLALNHYFQTTEEFYYSLMLGSYHKLLKAGILDDQPADLKSKFIPAISIPNINFADDLRIPALTIDTAKNIQTSVKKIRSNNSPLYPAKWKFDENSRDNDSSIIERNKELFDLFKVDQYGQPSLRNSNEQIKNPVLGYPALKDNWINPESLQLLSNALPIPGASGIGLAQSQAALDAGTLFNTDEISGADMDGKYRPPGNWGGDVFGDGNNDTGISTGSFANQNDETGSNIQADDLSAAGSNQGRTVNINLNTPLIGNFTINTNEGRGGIADLRSNVEDALLEILNSANAA